MNSVSKWWSSLWIKRIIISRLYQFNACWKFDLVICYINYMFSSAFCIMTMSGLLIAYVQKERTTFICKRWRGRLLFFFGTSVNNNSRTQLIKSNDVPQHQRYGKLNSYVSVVPYRLITSLKVLNFNTHHVKVKMHWNMQTQLWRLRHFQNSRGNLFLNEI